MPVTPTIGLATPLGIDLDNVPQWMLSLASDLDNKMFAGQSGTLASRPSAATGRFYYATDTLLHYLSDGTTWRALQSTPTPAWARFYAPEYYATGPITPGFQFDVSWSPVAHHAEFTSSGVEIRVPRPGIYRIIVELQAAQFDDNPGNVNHAVYIQRVAFGFPVQCYSQVSAKQSYAGAPLAQSSTVKAETMIALDCSDDENNSFRVQYASSWGGPGGLAGIVATPIDFGGTPDTAWMDVQEVCPL